MDTGKRDYYYCENCGYISSIEYHCPACQDHCQIYFGQFADINEAYFYFHTEYKLEHDLNY